jgi:hypothetical protein
MRDKKENRIIIRWMALLAFILSILYTLFPIRAHAQVFGGAAKRVQRFASAPASCNTGDIYFNTIDTAIYSCTSSNVWVSTSDKSMFAALYGGYTNPASFTWSTVEAVPTWTAANTATDSVLYLRLDGPADQAGRFMLGKYTTSAPTPPYNVTMIYRWDVLRGVTGAEQHYHFGLGLRESSSGKVAALELTHNSSYAYRNYGLRVTWATSTTVVNNSGILSYKHDADNGQVQGLRLRDDGTDLILYKSSNGRDWVEIMRDTKANAISGWTPNQIGFYIAGGGGHVLDSSALTVYSFEIE